MYQTEDGLTKIEVEFDNENAWLTQNQMVELFQTSKSNISEHISNIFKEGELEESSVVRNSRITAADGKAYNTKLYKPVEDLTAVERDFLLSLKQTQKVLEKKTKKD